MGYTCCLTFLGILVNTKIECEEVFGNSFLLRQTLQQKYQLFLSQSLQPIRAKTPAFPARVWETKHTVREGMRGFTDQSGLEDMRYISLTCHQFDVDKQVGINNECEGAGPAFF